jgi:homoserine O-succinyltransferase
MPLVSHSPLPTFERLRAEGEEILDVELARHQDIRELHVGFLNMMPDAAFQATERQFLRLVGSCSRIVQVFVHPFTLPRIERGDAIAAHVSDYYERFEDVAAAGLDALIITGANVPEHTFEDAPFWDELVEVLEFARVHVTSSLCACLATHAALHHFHGVHRLRMPRKSWGVFAHRAQSPDHPLVRGTNTRFDVPHSRYNDIPAEAMTEAGARVLAASPDAGVHLATSSDGVRFVFFQGHPEYDRESLLKEYRREVMRFLHGDRLDYPPVPESYFSPEGVRLTRAFEAQVAAGRPEDFPEAQLLATVDNTWGDTARVVFNNWLGLVYRLTDFDRHVPFGPGIDPDHPL